MFSNDFLLEPIAFQVYFDGNSGPDDLKWICVICGRSYHHTETHGRDKKVYESNDGKRNQNERLGPIFDEENNSRSTFSGFDPLSVTLCQRQRRTHLVHLDLHIEKHRRNNLMTKSVNEDIITSQRSSRVRWVPLLGLGQSITSNESDHVCPEVSSLKPEKCASIHHREKKLSEFIELSRKEPSPMQLRTYECYLCHQQFGDYESTSIHMRIHTGFKPF